MEARFRPLTRRLSRRRPASSRCGQKTATLPGGRWSGCGPQTKLRGKSKEGGRSPLLGRFKGVCKGARLPRESSEAIRVGKGGTTERTMPVRRLRRTGRGMWSLFRSKSPFAILSFDRQRRFLSHTRKKAGLKSSNGRQSAPFPYGVNRQK